MKKTGGSFLKALYSLFVSVKSLVMRFLSWLMKHKKKTVLVLIILVMMSFLGGVLNGQSKWIKIEKIPDGYVGIDLKKDRILQS